MGGVGMLFFWGASSANLDSVCRGGGQPGAMPREISELSGIGLLLRRGRLEFSVGDRA